jgi:hypothetical protein
MRLAVELSCSTCSTTTGIGGTLADGTYGEVKISAETVARAQLVIQQVIDAFSWRGPRQHRPM